MPFSVARGASPTYRTPSRSLIRRGEMEQNCVAYPRKGKVVRLGGRDLTEFSTFIQNTTRKAQQPLHSDGVSRRMHFEVLRTQ